MASAAGNPEAVNPLDLALICHCRRVTYETVREAVREGDVMSLAEVQQRTNACTHCFGCRFEIEHLLEDHLGDRFVRTSVVQRPPESETTATERPPKRMYMPILHRLNGEVTTRVVLFNWPTGNDKEPPVEVRADILDLDGERLDVWTAVVGPRQSAVLDIGERLPANALRHGVGAIKLVLDADRVGSMRPYFHFITPGGVTSTHEKAAPRKDQALRSSRSYFWIYPVARLRRPTDAWFFFSNAIQAPLADHSLVWCSETGEEIRVPLPELELDQSVCVPLHEFVPALRTGREAGTVRLEPSTHIAGFILRHDREADLWRVQHL